MFGYVRLHKPTIRMGEYEQYRGVYCTLCRRLGRRYGPFARMSLNYDLTFLALLDMALDNDDPDFCAGRCSYNPFKRCARCRNTRATDRAADISALLTYYKLRDTLADGGIWHKLGAALLYPLAAIDRRRAAKRYPAADERIAAMMAAQTAVERDNNPSVDAAAEPFAELLGWLAAEIAPDDTTRRVLTRFGYCLGRWVYLIDAADDLADDLKRRNYNPYLARDGITDPTAIADTRRGALPTLNACLAECLAAYELLDIRRFDGILRNIITEGMPAIGRRVILGEDTP